MYFLEEKIAILCSILLEKCSIKCFYVKIRTLNSQTLRYTSSKCRTCKLKAKSMALEYCVICNIEVCWNTNRWDRLTHLIISGYCSLLQTIQLKSMRLSTVSPLTVHFVSMFTVQFKHLPIPGLFLYTNKHIKHKLYEKLTRHLYP